MDNDSFSHGQDLIDILKGGESQKAEYPPELLAARRKLFVEQLEKHAQHHPASELDKRDHKLLNILRNWKSVEPEYPPPMLTRRRSLYQQRIAETLRSSVWHILRSSLSSLVVGWVSTHRWNFGKFVRASTLALGVAMSAFVAYAMYDSAIKSGIDSLAQSEIFTPTSMPVASTAQTVILLCEDGSEPPLCLAGELSHHHNLTDAGNGTARPAVAKDSYTGYGKIHRAAHVNDGLYGPDTSWVSNSPNSWIKIDLGVTTDINTVAFGRDRLGSLNDGDPGRFIIAVATSDDMYANGNSSNDETEYIEVYDSEKAGFDGKISGAETVVALFEIKKVRFIKITFENPRTAVDEVDAFMSDPTVVAVERTKASPRDDSQPEAPTPLMVYTPIPTDTAIVVPIDTLPPTETVTSMPTDPPTPVDTPIPTDTPVPTEPTAPPPMDTPIPEPVYTPVTFPTDEPAPTDEPIEPEPDDGSDLAW